MREHTGSESLAVVADVGCGTGLSTALFAPHAKRLIGVEPDPAMPAVAKETLEGHDTQVLPGSAEQTSAFGTGPERYRVPAGATVLRGWLSPISRSVAA